MPLNSFSRFVLGFVGIVVASVGLTFFVDFWFTPGADQVATPSIIE